MNTQLHLPIRLRDSVSVDNFFPAGNEEAFSAFNGWLTRNTDKPVLFLHGVAGSGRSHLLQAACRFVSEKDQLSIYVPAGESGITVCIDDFDQVVGDKDWEEAVLEVHERLLSGNGRLLLAALQPPRVLGLSLPDLATRLSAGAVYRVQPLTENELPRAMQLRARRRGLELPSEVVEYLLRRVPRNSEAIFDLLDRVDEAAFAKKRRLTVPFIREFEKEID